MKKIIVIVAVCLLFATGCSNGNDSNAKSNVTPSSNSLTSEAPSIEKDKDIIEITEKLFVEKVNDIYINTKDYLGKTFKYEGMIKSYPISDTEEVFCVIRYGPGCCGTDGDCGFEILWDKEMPAENEWVELIGVLEEFEYEGSSYLRINAEALNVLETRGAETVS